MTRQAAKIDANQPAIVKALEKQTVQVISTAALGNGFPDLMCIWNKCVIFLEVKAPGKTLQTNQRKWFDDCNAPCFEVHTSEEAVKAVTDGFNEIVEWNQRRMG